MQNKWYSIFKNILMGPFLTVYNRPSVEGMEKVPSDGPALMVSNHQSVLDSFYLPLTCPRQITFLAKKEYFTAPGLVGRLQKWFFTSVGQVPIDRESAESGRAAIKTGVRILSEGDLFGIYPEGTRAPDTRVYRGKTGMARIALESGAPIIPVAMLNTRKANPVGSWIPRPVKVGVRVGDGIDPLAFAREHGLDPTTREAARALTDHVMHTLADLVGVEYVDAYAKDVKARLAEGKGYPEGLAPKQS